MKKVDIKVCLSLNIPFTIKWKREFLPKGYNLNSMSFNADIYWYEEKENDMRNGQGVSLEFFGNFRERFEEVTE